MGNPVIWFEVAGKDFEGAKKFYGDLFDWTITDLEGGPAKYAAVATDAEAQSSGGIGEAPEGSPGHVTWYVQVDDLPGYLSKAEELGGKKVFDPIDIPGGQIAMFTDPEGHAIGLINITDPPA